MIVERYGIRVNMQQIILDSLFKYYEWCGNFKNIV